MGFEGFKPSGKEPQPNAVPEIASTLEELKAREARVEDLQTPTALKEPGMLTADEEEDLRDVIHAIREKG